MLCHLHNRNAASFIITIASSIQSSAVVAEALFYLKLLHGELTFVALFHFVKFSY